MNAWDNAFERRWTIIFLLEYVFIMLPFPFFFDTDYVPSFFGVPQYIYGWIAYGIFVLLSIVVWWRQCIKRPEYQDDNEE